jgi:hypothetical protein
VCLFWLKAEAFVILVVSDKGGSMCSAQADAIATLVVCSIILVGAVGGSVAWAKEVKDFVSLSLASVHTQTKRKPRDEHILEMVASSLRSEAPAEENFEEAASS